MLIAMEVEVAPSCCVPGCEARLEPGEAMCRGHWQRLPWPVRYETGLTWRPPAAPPPRWLGTALAVLDGVVQRDLKPPRRRRSIYRTPLTVEEQRLRPIALAVVQQYDRPQTRGECGTERPCPWVSCRANNYLDVTPGGTIKLNHPGLEPWEVPPERSCALDVAELGGVAADEAGAMVGLRRGRVGQMERRFRTLLRHRIG